MANPRIIRAWGSTFTKRVVLMFDRKPTPAWKFSWDTLEWPRKAAVVTPVTFDGRYWIEARCMPGGRAHRVVRAGWPAFDETADPDTDMGWPKKMQRAHGYVMRDLRVATDRDYLSVISYWPMLPALLGLWIAWKILPILLSLPVLSLFCYLGTVIVRGGFGNVPVAKDMLGIRNPFILTTYQLDQHVGKKREVQIEEGLAESAT